MNLTRAWANWEASKPPFILDLDRPVLNAKRNAQRIITIGGWERAYRARDFCAPKDSRLHLGLLPQPFLGDMGRASIYVLGLNPGLGPGDYYAEYEDTKFRKALLANLRQKFKRRSLPFLFLDPQYAWHGGFNWWHRKLAGVISNLSEEVWGVDYAKAREVLAGKLASIELMPYHSVNSAGGWIRRLPSVSLAVAFVHDEVMPRVKRGDAIIVVLRQKGIWDLKEYPGQVVCYRSNEALAASLSPVSRGGKAILRHLKGQ